MSQKLGNQQDYAKLAEDARQRRKMLESRRKQLEDRLREPDESFSFPDQLEEVNSDRTLGLEYKHEVEIEDPAPRQIVQSLPTVPGRDQRLRRTRDRARFRLLTRSDLRNAVLAQEVLGSPKGLQS